MINEHYLFRGLFNSSGLHSKDPWGTGSRYLYKQFALGGLEQTKQCAISLISLGFPSFLPWRWIFKIIFSKQSTAVLLSQAWDGWQLLLALCLGECWGTLWHMPWKHQWCPWSMGNNSRILPTVNWAGVVLSYVSCLSRLLFLLEASPILFFVLSMNSGLI